MGDLETLLTASILTATPMNTSSHDKLFTLSADFYQARGNFLPASVRPLDTSVAMASIEAVANARKPSVSPVYRSGRQFVRSSLPSHPDSHSRSPSPSSVHPLGKLERDQSKELERLDQDFHQLHARIFEDVGFASLSVEEKCTILNNSSSFAKKALARLETFESNAKRRAGRTRPGPSDSSLTEQRHQLRERLRNFHGKTYALFAPLIPESPIDVNAGKPSLTPSLNLTHGWFRESFHRYFQHGPNKPSAHYTLYSVQYGDWAIHSTMQLSTRCRGHVCVKLGMSTINFDDSNPSHSFSSSQNKIIADMPTSLSDALKRFGVNGCFDLYAACPSCNFTYRVHSLGVKGFYDLPERCDNTILSKDGNFICNTSLLKCRLDGSPQPVKPYLVPSLSDYLARSLLDRTYIEQCTHATDKALHNIQTHQTLDSVSDVFEANFIKDFKGPDGKLFVDRGDKIRLAFSIHLDFFNPNGIRYRGNHDSIGVISCANLALDPSIQYLPENMFLTIIPGPIEPSADEIDHFVRPILEQFLQAWRPGFKVSCTADSDSPVVVEVAILLSVNDLPAARKIAGLQGHMSALICSICDLCGKEHIFSTDHQRWTPRDVNQLRHWSKAYRDAQSYAERKKIFETHGARWSSFWLLEYWDPTKMLVIDAMHCILEGLIHYHCRHVLRLDASATKLSAEGLKFAYDWPWIPYVHEAVPAEFQLPAHHFPLVAKVQKALCLAIEGEKSMTLNQIWTRLDNQVTLGVLKFVTYTLGLPTSLVNIDTEISLLYVQRGKLKAKDPELVTFPFNQSATYKNHFIALLLNWVSSAPRFINKV